MSDSNVPVLRRGVSEGKFGVFYHNQCMLNILQHIWRLRDYMFMTFRVSYIR